MRLHVRTLLFTVGATLAALAVSDPARAADGKVVVVRAAESSVVSEIVDGFRSAHPGAAFEDVLLTDAKSEAALVKRLEGATAILSIGAKAAVAVAKAKPAGRTIAVLQASQADPATMGPTMRLQPPADGLIAAIPWMSGRFRKVGLVLDALERQKIAEVECTKRGIEVTARTAKDARDVVTAVSELLTKNDVVLVDVSDGLQGSDVQFMLRAAQDAKIPLVGTSEGFVRAGAPAAITIDPRSVGAEAGKLAKEGAAGMFDPRRFRVMVNLVAMDRLGVSVSRDKGSVDANILVVDTEAGELIQSTKAIAVTRPAVAKQGRLLFPELAKRNNIRSADVVLDIEVKADGSIGLAKVVKGEELFGKAALDSIKSWQFRPGTRDGAPVDDKLRLNLKFQL